MVVNSAKLLGGTAGVQLASLALVPILTRVLSPSEVGSWDLIQFAMSLIAVLLMLELPAIAGMRLVARSQDTSAQAETFTASLHFFKATSLTFVALYSICGWFIIRAWIPHSSNLIIVLLPVAAILSTLQLNVVSLAQHAGLVTAGVGVNLFSVLLNVGVAMLTLLLFRQGVIGLLEARIVAGGCGLGVTLWLCRPWMRRNKSLRDAFPMAKAALPLLPYSISFFLLTYGDRTILVHFVSLSEIGTYSVASKMNAMAFAGFTAIVTAYVLEYYKAEERVLSPVIRVLTIRSAAGIALVVYAVSEFATVALRILAPPAFASAAAVVPALLIGQGCFGIVSLLWVELIAVERTTFIGIAMAIAAATDLVLTAVLSPTLGIQGAAVAQLGAFTVLLVVVAAELHRRSMLVRGAREAISLIAGVGLLILFERGFLHLALAPRLIFFVLSSGVLLSLVVIGTGGGRHPNPSGQD